MNKKNCKEALDIYKKFLDRTDNVSAFLKVAEVSKVILLYSIYIKDSIILNIFQASGIDKSDIPDLTKVKKLDFFKRFSQRILCIR